MLMSVSGIYAGTVQITNGSFHTGGVSIQVQTYTLNSNNEEVKYEDEVVMPSDIISFIPKIENNGDSCFVRAHIFYINENIDASDYITGMSSDWEKRGEYYYYKKPLNEGETLKLFDTLEIPSNIYEIINGEKIKIDIIADVVQEKNFEPDYEKSDPWNGVVPVKSVNTKYDIDTNTNSNITIRYENGANEDIEIPSNFFEDMKRIMPGDSYSSSLKIKNTNKKGAKYYFKCNIEDKDESIKELLNNLELEITNEKGQVLYNDKVKNNENILLGEFNKGEEGKLDFKIKVSNQLTNQYANLNEKLNYVFSVDYEKIYTENNNVVNLDKTNPQTGDKINVAMTIFLISAIGLIIVLILDYREKRNIE